MPATMTAPTAAPSPNASQPSPAPKAAPAPAKTSRPDIVAPVETNDAFQDAFADLDAMDRKQPAPRKEPAKAVPEKEGVEPRVEEVQNESSKDAKVDPEPKPTEGKPVKVQELRTAYETLKAKVTKEYEPALKRLPELEARVKEFESRDESAGKATQERISAIERRNAELESHIKFVDYEKSTEYQDKFQKPYEEAWGNALRELRGLKMTTTDAQSGEDVTRDVTQADIAYFANLDPATRRTEINRLFPDDKEEVKRHINQISLLADQSHAAKEKARTDAAEYAKTSQAKYAEGQSNQRKLWQTVNKSLAEKYPNWFSRKEGDPDGNAIFDRGSALADLAMNPQELTPERVALLPKVFQDQIASQKPFSQEQFIRLHAIVGSKAANHDRLAHQNKTLTARVTELEKNLKEFEASGPDSVRAGKPVNGATADASWESELDAMDRKGR